ncbi:MAG TPA: IucA/IucC family protein [Solirubrobacteraceae bacterium]|jgi:siderophore synthetase component|nr:IucA/IucC family protein [Solirubrobacteraceae bacterium]
MNAPDETDAERDEYGDLRTRAPGHEPPPTKLPEVPQTPGRIAAVNTVTEAVLNSYTREGGQWRPLPAETVPDLAEEGDAFVAVIPFPEERSALLAGVRYLSPTHRHRFRTPTKVAMAGGVPWTVSLDTAMSMLADDLGETHAGDEMTAAHLRGPDPTFLLSRIRQNVATMATFLDARQGDVDELWSAAALRFIDSEQAALVGNLAHPTAKSRWGIEPEQMASYAPELQARFALRWLAVDPALVEQGSASGAPASELLEQLLRDDPAVDGPALDAALADLGERVLLPVHPWELEYLRSDGRVARLLEDGLIVELGALGGEVSPTASMRTVYRADWPWQLTFALHAHMTDEMRLPPIAELERGVDAARRLGESSPPAAELAPQVTLLQDPAFVAIVHDGVPLPGLSVQLRENRWRAGSQAGDVSAVEGLLQDHPFGGESRLAQIVRSLADAADRPADEIAREWFVRYADVAIVPLLRLRDELGLAIESNQQNTLLELEGGWPVHVVLRDAHGSLQGQAVHDDVAATSPGIGEGPFVDNALGIINALGAAGIVEELVLLGDLKALLERERDSRGSAGDAESAATESAALLGRLLGDATWPCLAKMHTRLHNDVDRYVQIPNPLHGVRG